jgi:hypothetical protein
MGPEDMLAMREGYTVADASSLFDASFASRPNLIDCGVFGVRTPHWGRRSPSRRCQRAGAVRLQISPPTVRGPAPALTFAGPSVARV